MSVPPAYHRVSVNPPPDTRRAARRKGRAPRPPIEHPDPREMSLQGILEALVDPVRRDIVLQLAASEEPMRCGAFDARVSLSTLTHHFHVLREAGVIRQFYEGTSKLNA